MATVISSRTRAQDSAARTCDRLATGLMAISALGTGYSFTAASSVVLASSPATQQVEA